MTSVYRLSSAKYPANSGAGAARFGGRWNKIGVPAIYAAESRSLAALEVLVHYDVIPRDFVVTEVRIPNSLHILIVEVADLSSGWDAEVISSTTQEIGNLWANARRSAVLSVPSSVVPLERNFVINPLHPDFDRIEFSSSMPFRFDPRLK